MTRDELIVEAKDCIERDCMSPRMREIMSDLVRLAEGLGADRRTSPDSPTIGHERFDAILQDEGWTLEDFRYSFRNQVDGAKRDRILWRLRNEGPVVISYPNVARLAGVSSHSSVVGACKRHERRMKEAKA